MEYTKKTTFQPGKYLNVPSKDIVTDKVYHHPQDYTYNNDSNTSEQVESVVRQIEARHIDIAYDYHDWVKVGFALADEFGDMGKDYFARLSRQHPDCSDEAVDKQYRKCLESRGSGITIATFFQMAKDAGIDISNHNAKKIPNIQTHENGYMDKWTNGYSGEVLFNNSQISKCPNIHEDKSGQMDISDEDGLPTFPEDVYSSLPPIIKEAVGNASSPDERAVILLGALACLSSTIHNMYGIYYQKVVFPNLFVFITADAGMGKGALTFCKELVSPIHEEIAEISERQYKEYKEAKANAKRGCDGENGCLEEPGRQMLIIPANSSASSFCQILNDNNGIGLLFETEADALGGTLNSEYGNYSYVLRQAAHHEPVSLSRSKDRTYINIQNPRLSVCLSGTPQQMLNLMPTAENGLFSRASFYSMPFKLDFGNVLSVSDFKESKTSKFKKLGRRYYNLRSAFFRGGTFKMVIPDILQPAFLDHFEKVNKDMVEENGKGMQAVVRRHGLTAFRIMMIFTALRAMTSGRNLSAIGNGLSTSTSEFSDEVYEKSTPLTCSEEDFNNALKITDVLLSHAAYKYIHMPKGTSFSGTSKKADVLFGALPETFTRSEYDAMSKSLGMSLSTTNKWLYNAVKAGSIQRTSQGQYSKVHA